MPRTTTADNACSMSDRDRDVAMANTGESESAEDLVMANSRDSMSDQYLIDCLSINDIPLYVPCSHLDWFSKKIQVKVPKVYGDLASSIGYLDKLPLELLHIIFNTLDFQSLSRFSRTSLRAHALVRQLPAYMDLIRYAPWALASLAGTGLIVHHSAGTLRAVLRSENCSSCGSFGAHLFVLTCQRFCEGCLLHNQSLWLVQSGVAALCFRIPRRRIDQLPTIRLSPRTLYPDLNGSKNFVSVGSAKKLALAIHGSEANIQSLAIRSHFTTETKRLYEHYRAAPLQPYDSDPFLMPNARDPFNEPLRVRNPSIERGCVRFPSTASGVKDQGHRCRGCYCLYARFYGMPQHVRKKLAPNHENPSHDFKQRMFYRECSREEFLQHIRMCYGVRRFVEGDANIKRWLQEIAHIPIDQWKRG